MGSRILALAAIGLACILAAGGGAYLAVRQAPPTQVTAPGTDNQAPAGAHGTPARIVTTPPAASDIASVPSMTPLAESNGRREVVDRAAKGGHRPSDRRAATTGTPVESDTSAGLGKDQGASNSNAKAAADVPLNAPGTPVAPTVPPVPVPVPAPEPQREYVDVTVPADSVLGLQVQTAVSSETAKVEDQVEARVTREVRVNDRIAIPAGSEVLGSVVQVDRGGKVRERAQFAIRFHTLVLPDGSRTTLTAEALHREGPSPANKSAARIWGATVGGAILGAILGGGKGAAIGSGIGAAGGTAATMASDRQPATLAAGSMVNVRLMSPVVITLER